MRLLHRRHGVSREGRHVAIPESAYRRDIQGLRAIAVLLVVLDHAGVSFLSGGYVGVDVFFVLSGFLITGLLLAAVERDGYVSFVDFYIRRAKRILPAATLTLVATIVASCFLLNVVRARQAIWDSLWASLFGANIRFAQQGTDYFAQGQPPSPIQHFWSLSVEEQFYFVWPALLSVSLFGTMLGARVGNLRAQGGRVVQGWRARRLLAVMLVAAAATLTWSVFTTESDPTSAYFSTFTRAWELALGAILAVVGARVARLTAGTRAAMSWVGLAAIGLAAVRFSPTTSFPGYAALLPTLGTVLVIAGGSSAREGRRNAARALAVPALRYVGDRSYAFYLWHWPVLVIAAQYEGRDLPVSANLMLAAGAFVLSIISYALVENPIRRSHWSPSATWTLVPASATAVAATAMFALTAIDAKVVDDAVAAETPNAVTQQPLPATTTGALPAVVEAVEAARRRARLPTSLTPPADRLLDEEFIYHFPDGCAAVSDEETTSEICRLGSTSSTRTMVVFGDSHAQMWMPTILGVAAREGWVVVPLVKPGCIPSAWLGGGYENTPSWWLRLCHEWYTWASRQARALRPDVLLMTGCCAAATALERETIRAYAALAATVDDAARRVIVIGDAEGADQQPVDCLLAREADMRTCTSVRSDEQFAFNDDLETVARMHGYGFLDTRGWFCFEHECPLVVGRTIVYRDKGHITQPYALSLVEPFRASFRLCVTRGCPT